VQGGTLQASPSAMYSPDGGACFNGREASAPQLHRTTAPAIPLSAGKTAAPTLPDGAQPSGKATAHSPPLTETRRVPDSRSSATPSVLPAANQPLASSPLGGPLPLATGHQKRSSVVAPRYRTWKCDVQVL
jgi:hypothetical protein